MYFLFIKEDPVKIYTYDRDSDIQAGYITPAEMDFIREYDTRDKKYIIRDESERKIADVKLDTPMVVNVMRGKDRKIAEFTINNEEDYENVFRNMEFIDMNTGKIITRDYKLKYREKVGEYPSTITTDTVCEDEVLLGNGSIQRKCNNIKETINNHGIKLHNNAGFLSVEFRFYKGKGQPTGNWS